MRTVLAIVLAFTGATAAAAGDPRVGQQHFAVCAGCHGFAGEGNAAVRAPALSGREAWDVARQLDHFRSGLRGYAPEDTAGRQMATMALALADDRAKEDVVAYLGTLPAAPANRTSDGEGEGDSIRGRAQYAVCGACHGANGEGTAELSAPKLAGLESWYVVAQLDAFRRGWRGTQPEDTSGQQMRAIVMALQAEQLSDLAAFIATL